jgi:hypothetical protein
MMGVYDALGKLTKVFEPDGSITIPNTSYLETDCSYNALDNLTTVNQHGLIRNFNYDGLSRGMPKRMPPGCCITKGHSTSRPAGWNSESHRAPPGN